MNKNIQTIVDETTPAFQSWLAGAIKINHDHMKEVFSTLPLPVFEATSGSRYIRIMRDRSAHAFIDRTNGDVMKPASWKVPAKGARGNIFDEANGLARMQEYGPAYNRR